MPKDRNSHGRKSRNIDERLSQSAAGGGPRRTASLTSLFGGDHEGDSPNGVGFRDLWFGQRGGRQGSRPRRDVEVRVRDRRPEAYVHPDDQEGRGQARRHDELAGSEGDRSQGPEAEGRYSDFFRRAEDHE